MWGSHWSQVESRSRLPLPALALEGPGKPLGLSHLFQGPVSGDCPGLRDPWTAEKGIFSLRIPEGPIVDCKIGLKFFLSLFPGSLAVPSDTNAVLGHVTCFAQWDFSKLNANEGLKNACEMEFAHLLHLEHRGYLGKETELICWRVRGHREGHQGTPADSYSTIRVRIS